MNLGMTKSLKQLQMDKQVQLKDIQKEALLTQNQNSTELTVQNCLEAKQMIYLLNRGARQDIATRIDAEITVCLELLQVNLSDQAIKVLVDDIISVYKWDSLEDTLITFRNGRRGQYGKNYGKFNMIVFTQWMKEHLTEKSILRESLLEREKGNLHDWNTWEEYLQAVEIGNINQNEIKKKGDLNSRKEHDYQSYKGKYLLKKQSEAEKLEEVEVSGEKC